jgi:hypothetical protein
MNHLHVLLLPFPYTFDAVAVLVLSDMAVASKAFIVLVDAITSSTLWMLFGLTIPKGTICSKA